MHTCLNKWQKANGKNSYAVPKVRKYFIIEGLCQDWMWIDWIKFGFKCSESKDQGKVSVPLLLLD